MLIRKCDRCGAEMPMEQTMGEDELILRQLNNKPFDLCIICQDKLQSWMKREWPATIGTGRIMCSAAKVERFSLEKKDDKRNGDSE